MSARQVMTPEEFDKYLDDWCNDERVVTAYKVAHRALADATQRAEKAERFIADEGYRRCDVMRCNCGSWHAAEGWYARFRDIENATQEDWQNGETLIARVKRIVSERDAARARIAELEALFSDLPRIEEFGDGPVRHLEVDAEEYVRWLSRAAEKRVADVMDERETTVAELRKRIAQLEAQLDREEKLKLLYADERDQLRADLAKRDEGERRTWFEVEYLWGDNWVVPSVENDNEQPRPLTLGEARAESADQAGLTPSRIVEVTRRVLSDAESEGSNG